jgi:hypothetical protein
MVAERVSSPPIEDILGDGIVRARCPHCRGNVIASEGELSCLMCSQPLQPTLTRRRANGTLDVLDVEPRRPRSVRISTAGHMAERRVARQLARDEGTSRAAAVFALLPRFPEVISASKIARTLSLSKSETEQTLAELLAAGRCRKAIYDPTYFYVGYYKR